MWLKDYLHKRWGLFVLVGGITVIGLWLLGGGNHAGRRRTSGPRPGPGTAKASLKAEPSPPKKMTAASVSRYCTERGVVAARPAQAQPQTVRHPGFPAPRATSPTLGAKARGLFPLERKLLSLGPRQLTHAPMLHRLAQGFTERTHYFAYLMKNQRAARRYYRKQSERRRKKGQGGAPGSVNALGKARIPSLSLIALKARGYRNKALGFYHELTSTTSLKKYPSRAQALLEYASLLMTPPPRAQPRRPGKRKKKGAQNDGPSRQSIEALRVLHLLLSDHPRSPEAIEAMALLAHRTAARGQCPKVIFLLKGLSSATLPPNTTPRTALLRGLAHYHAGRCLLQRGSHGAAAKRLHTATADARQAQAAGEPLAGPLAREAAILWARAYGAAGEPSDVHAQLARLGPKLAKIASGVLVSQLLKEGQLRVSMRLCTPPKPAPTGAP